MTGAIRARAVFGRQALARISHDEPATAHDAATGVDLHYRFEHAAGGVLRLRGGPLGDDTLAVGCDEHCLELVATLLLDGIRARTAASTGSLPAP